MALDERDKVAHLLRRAGFAARPEEIEAGVSQGLQATVDQLLNFETIPDNLAAPPPGLDYNTDERGNQPRGWGENVIGWWLNAMIKTTRPLQEKMVLFWHGLFATAVQNMDPSIRQVYLQNQLFRGNFNPLLPRDRRTPEDTNSPFPLGNFRVILKWLSRDPAMGYWLDNYVNTRKDNEVGTNENYARELLELFSLGVEDVVAKVPNYTETDVRQLSRVLTGWSVLPVNLRDIQTVDGLPNNFPRWFAFQPTQGRRRIEHDPGPYTVLGVTFGSFGGNPSDGSRMFDVIVQHRNAGQQQSACGRFLGYRLFKFFGYDEPEPEVINYLADVFDGRHGEAPHLIRNLLAAVFTPGNPASDAFYSERAFKAHVKSPVEYFVSTYRLLKPEGLALTYPPAGQPGVLEVPISLGLALASLNQMGQLLFYPPDVSGWKEGMSWINTTFDLARFNFASGVIAGYVIRRQGRDGVVRDQRFESDISTASLRTLLTQNGARTPEQVVDYLTSLMFQVPVSAETRTALIHYLRAGADGTPGTFPFNVNNNATIDNKVRGLIHLIMTSPEYQLS